MTDKAIEAGARADLLPCPFCGGEAVRKHGYWIECASCEASIRAPRENITVDGATKKWNTRALASGALVPASAVAAERERCAQFIDQRADRLLAKAKRTTSPSEKNCFGRGVELRQAAHALRALPPAPASGEVVVGWRDISTVPKDGSLILAASNVTGARCVVGWQPANPAQEEPFCEAHWNDVGSKNAAPAIYINANYFTHWIPLPAPPAMLNAATKDGNRP